MTEQSNAEERLLAKVDKTPSGCWGWRGCFDPGGYGRFRLDGRMRLAHRASYLIYIGEIPEGMHLDHLCRNTWCVNPEHLEPVTQAQNNARQKVSRGGTHTGAILREEDVRQIKARIASGERQMDLAIEYGVVKSTISALHRGKSWKHVD